MPACVSQITAAPPFAAPGAPRKTTSVHEAFRALTRPRRIAVALLAMWVLNLFDLHCTLSEAEHCHFVEMNPIAAKLMESPWWVLAGYKFALVGFGTAILVFLRRHSVAELGAWFLLTTYAYVGVRWYVYFECLYADKHNIMVAAMAWSP